MIELVIKIPEKIYNALTHTEFDANLVVDEMRKAIANGATLLEHHGRLIDADSTLATAWTNFYKHEDELEKKDNDYLPFGRMYDQNGFECCQQTIVNAPTIIEGSDNE